jgi:hypothetical protein
MIRIRKGGEPGTVRAPAGAAARRAAAAAARHVKRKTRKGRGIEVGLFNSTATLGRRIDRQLSSSDLTTTYRRYIVLQR